MQDVRSTCRSLLEDVDATRPAKTRRRTRRQLEALGDLQYTALHGYEKHQTSEDLDVRAGKKLYSRPGRAGVAEDR